MAKAYFIALETLLEDPENQVLGFTHVCDITGITAAHITNWNPTDFARILKWGEQSVPARHKAVHCVNVPHAVKFVLDFAKSKVSPKMKERFQVHCNNSELHKQVSKNCKFHSLSPLSHSDALFLFSIALTNRSLCFILQVYQLNLAATYRSAKWSPTGHRKWMRNVIR